MVLIRRFEDTVNALFLKGLVHGTTHLCSGQEAAEVGVTSVLKDGDRVAGTYRGHGHALALGLDPQRLLDELLGRRLDRWRARDPLVLARRRLVDEHGVPEWTGDTIVEEVAQLMERVQALAIAAPFPEANASAREFKDG